MALKHLAELGPVVLVAVATSQCIGYALSRVRIRLERLQPEARWRVAFLSAWAPFLAAMLFVLGASFDWMMSGPGAFCLREQTSWLMGLLACTGLSAATWRLWRVLLDVLQSWRTSRALAKSSCDFGGYRQIPSVLPVAFVAGLLRPKVYVSGSLLDSLEEDDLAVVLAHEQSHRRRRDPLRRVLANVALCFHLPHAADRISTFLSESQELIADRAAARTVGDPLQVAETLVRCGKLQWSASQGFAAFSGASLERRLHQLFAGHGSIAQPTLGELLTGFFVVVLVTGLWRHAIHFGWQLLLRMP